MLLDLSNNSNSIYYLWITIRKIIMNDKEVKEMAEKHWEYVESICHKMYVDAFIHGYKHGSKDGK